MNGNEFESLQKALCAAFDLAALDQMMMFRLSKRREDIAGDGALTAIVFNVITVAIREGWVGDLILGALGSNPKSPALKHFVESHPALAPKYMPVIGHEYLPIGSPFQRSVEGAWEGLAHQLIGPENWPITHKITMDHKLSERIVSGLSGLAFSLADGRTQSMSFHLEGGFPFGGRLLRLEYRNMDQGVFQFGTALLDPDDGGKHLNGTYAGYGSMSHRPVCGYIRMTRSPKPVPPNAS